MNFLNLFRNKRIKESNFQILYELANCDGKPLAVELYMLNMNGKINGLSEIDQKKIIETMNIPRHYPKSNIKKVELITDMCMLMCIKNEIKVVEYNYCLNICNEMKIDDKIVDEQIFKIISNSEHLLNGKYNKTMLESSFREVMSYKLSQKLGLTY